MTNQKETEARAAGSFHKQLNASFLAVIALIVFTIVLFLFIAYRPDATDIRFDNESPSEMTGTFTVSYGGESVEATLPCNVDASAGEVVTLSRILHTDDISGNYLMFYIKQNWVHVTLGDTVLFETAESTSLPFRMAPSSYWCFFELPDDYDGQALAIELTTDYEGYAGGLPAVYSGTKTSLIYMVLKQGRFSLLVGIPALVLGILLIAAGCCLRHRSAMARLVRFGLFVLALSIWSLLESRITQLFFGDLMATSCILFSCLFLMPMLACSFLLTFPSIARCRYMHVLFWISGGVYLLLQFCQILGIATYMDMISVSHLLIVAVICCMIKCALDYRKRNDPEEKWDAYIYQTILLLAVFCVADLIYYYLNPTDVVGKFTKVGLLLSIMYVGYSVLREVRIRDSQSATHTLYKKLAFTDIMTGLGNRTAFEQKLSALREDHSGVPITLLMADINGLKMINDNYGHAKGDEAIVKTGHMMLLAIANTIRPQHGDKETAAECCSCYRLGGDEFCIIGVDVMVEQFIALEQELRRLIAEEDTLTSFPFSVATGIHPVDETGIDECFKKADAKMYERKMQSRTARQ